jgi:subtilase-type serine protease
LAGFGVGLHKGHRKRLRAALLGTSALVGASVALVSPLHAQSLWQGTTGDYGTPSNWDNNTPPTGGGQVAFFANSGVTTINVGSAIAPDGWFFLNNAQSYNVDGAAVQLGATGLINQAGAGTIITLGNSFAGSTAGIFQSGAGTLVLTGSGSTFAGPFFVSAGEVEVRGGSVDVADIYLVGSTLSVTNGGALTTPGTMSMNAASVLNIGKGGAAGTLSVSDITNDGQIIADLTNSSTLDANISGTGTITKNGAGTLILSGTSGYGTAGAVSTFVNAGTLSILGSSALGAGDASFANGTTFSLSTGGSYIDNNIFIDGSVTFNVATGVTSGIGNLGASGTIDGAGTLIKTGAGTLGLAGENTYTGDTHVREGTLQIDDDFALPETTNVAVNTGATLAISNGLQVDINSLANGANGGGSVTIGNSSTLYIGYAGGKTTTFGGGITGDGSLSIDGGSLTLTGVSSIGGDLLICYCGELNIVGAGASFTATGSAGSFGGTNVLGTLNVLNGAHFATDDLVVAGTMTVSGPNTSLTAGATAFGTYVLGMLNVRDGAMASLGALSVGGTMVIDGKNTAVTVDFDTFVAPLPGSLIDPPNLTVSGGAVLHSKSAAIIDGDSGLTAPTVTVTGPGSVWNIDTPVPTFGLFVGAYSGGLGNLLISAGGVVNVGGDTFIGSDPSFAPANATATVTGSGSQLNAPNLFVGGGFCGCPVVGTLTVADGGLVNVTSSMSIGLDSILYIGAGALGGTVVAPAITNDGQIIANFTDAVTLAANIDGTGTLQKLGTGTLFLTGANTYTGDTTIDGGKLVVNGSITSNVFVNAGGTLGGSGSVGATTINAGGALSPGNSIGTITINGSLTFVGAGNYIVEVSPTPGLADRTNVIGAPGTAALAGTITAVGTGYGYKIGSSYTVLNATGGLNNTTFSSLAISGSFGSAKPRVEYDANGVDVNLVFDANSLALSGLTPNQTAVANTINTALQQGLQLLAFDVAFNSPLGLDLLSGEVHASALGVLLDESLYPRQAVLGRLRQASYGGDIRMASLSFGGPQAFATDGTGFDSALAFAKSPIVRKAPLRAPQASSNDLVFWAQGFGAWGKFDSDGNAASVRRDLAGFFTGFDTRAGDAGRVGIAAGYTGSKNTLDGRGSSNVDTAHVAVYGGWNVGALNLRAGGAFAHHSINTDRTIAIPGFFDRTFSSYAGYTGQVFGEAGYGFNMQGVALEAFAGAAWVRVHANGTAERGGDAALNVAASSFEVGYGTLGLRAATIVPLANSMILVPRVTVAWQHAFGGTTPGVVNAFAAAPALPFLVQGVPIARDSVLAEAGVDVAITPQMTLGVSYTGQIARNVSDHGAKGKFSYRF